MNVNEAAAKLGVTPRRVRALIAAGSVPAFKHGGNWVVESVPAATRTRRPLSERSRGMLLKALHTRSLAGLHGQDLIRTAARIAELRSSSDPAKLLADWWGGIVEGPASFGTSLVSHAIGGDRDYVSRSIHRVRREYLRRAEDLADVIRSERTIRGMSRSQLADVAHVPINDIDALEHAKPLTSPAPARRVLRALDVEPTALPDLVTQ